MADKITFSWSKPPTQRWPSWRPSRIVKRNGVEVAKIGRGTIQLADGTVLDGWYWYITTLHRDGVGPKNTLAEGVVYADQRSAEADVRTWLREHPLVGVAPPKETA